ncbi:MAG TPA: YicC family protein [Ferruginibacter sp.]|nr:YicC family protein [Ferruginibacter sp.]MBN8699269.1 YicC family protein [Chitinophagales bacterium]TXH25796.1 MAG: YicC family protein [Cyclobacteriaceae bacterium]HMU72735.1 YicC family protein [Ferruginibacter sp.]HMW25047.1 YicC family protein [Ferruginibacter sp.]
MLKSMTGFGRAEQTIHDKTFLVEIKALNGKQFELQLKLPPLLRPYEFEIRNMLQETLVRGTIDCVITIKQNGTSKPVNINTDLIKAYYNQIESLAQELKIDTNSVLSALLRLPEVVTPTNDVLEENEYEEFKAVLQAALTNLNQHRVEEGGVLEKDLVKRISNINEQEEAILKLEPNRQKRIREEINQLLEKHVGKENIDNNRMEQELIYYMEKIDIHEEQIRLRQHCEYFRSILQESDEGKGKKLSFILQEIGREINTTGSKAYDADIQKCVVKMKDELEKAKEQVLNVL